MAAIETGQRRRPHRGNEQDGIGVAIRITNHESRPVPVRGRYDVETAA
jgi:hypothetical protein